MFDLPVNPVALQIGSLEIRWYSIFIVLAVFWLIFWMWWQVRKGAKLTTDTVTAFALIGIPSGIVVSRLLHVFDNTLIAKMHPELALSGAVVDYSQNWVSIIGGSGLTAWGAVLGAALGIWIYCRLTKAKIGYVFDLLAPGVIMAQAIGRFGCLFNGCCYGTPTSGPFGLTYTNPASLAPIGVATQPTVVYEIIFNVIVFGVLLGLRKRLKPAGSLFVVYMVLYSAWRIGIDFLRDGQPFLFGLHQAQIIGVVIIAIAVPWLAMHAKWVKKNEPVAKVDEIPSAKV